MASLIIHPQFKADFLKAVEKFMEDHQEDRNFPEVVVGDMTALYMTEAALTVLAACAESQEYGVDAGLFE